MWQEQEKSPSPWNPSDWSYLSEGGKHVIFRYSLECEAVQSADDDSSHCTASEAPDKGGVPLHFRGYVLRIAKSDLAKASLAISKVDGTANAEVGRGMESVINCHEGDGGDCDGTQQHCHGAKALHEESSSQKFQRLVLKPILGCYLDLPHTVDLPSSFCAHLYNEVVSSGLIPSSRLPPWNLDDKDLNHAKHIIQTGVRASLLRDHMTLAPQPGFPPELLLDPSFNTSNPNEPIILSVEIKPKAGYTAISPLVLPQHRCKYFRTRYSLHQELMQRGCLEKGWQKRSGADQHQFTPSNYSPLDLFSGDPERIEKALKDLSQNMQNNFRVWSNGQLLFGEYQTPSEESCRELLETLVGNSCNIGDMNTQSTISTAGSSKDATIDCRSSLLDLITSTISDILANEEILSELLILQKLDVVDGDGAVKLYERLVLLCGGSHAEAERLLDEACLVVHDYDRRWQHFRPNHWGNLVSRSPYTIPDSDELMDLLDMTYVCRLNLETNMKRQDLDENYLDAVHPKCNKIILDFEISECIYLLQNWLLSLAVCDVSFFVTFRFLPGVKVLHSIPQAGFDRDNKGGFVNCGVIDQIPMTVHYEVKVVDCDPKPAHKLRTLGVRERVFGDINIQNCLFE